MDCSTIDPTVSQDMWNLAKKKGAMFVDAPVSGGIGGGGGRVHDFYANESSHEKTNSLCF